MKTRQYCYFALKSDTLSAAEITRQLGMEPDEVRVGGSRSSEHVLPRCHVWRIVRHSDESVDEQIQHLVDRLNPIRSKLISLRAESNVDSTMQVVRYFHDQDGAQAAPGGTPWEQAQQRPRPLGWHLSMPVVEFLSATRTELDVDEYDLSDDDVADSPA
ncbi:DUF4279 domain-containing protein [Nocardia amikacinitolerans]|uniref:DUF4279 domain-containing protein n=1 Tax=Nocardia amikacinitolerans TaxID=756689 RepID=UPI0020A38F38|nr:DUF4279 domain-containing protein [Nocardia amikacinitolerans]